MDKSTICTCCGEDKKNLARNFYVSYSKVLKSRKRMTVCKDCIVILYGEFLNEYDDSKEALYYTCQLLDSYYEESVYKSSVSEAESSPQGNVARMYFRNINSLPQYKGKTFKDSERLSVKGQVKSKIKVKDENYEPPEEIVRIFGKNRSKEDLFYLENEYLDWTSRFRKEEITKAMEVLIKRICNLNLIIDKKDLKGDDTTKETRTLQDLMKSSNLTPSQDAGTGDEDPFGVMIKIRENHKPIPKPDPEWEDVSGIRKYMTVFFFGHLCKMMGINNDAAKMYEEEMNKYEVDLTNENNEGDDDSLW